MYIEKAYLKVFAIKEKSVIFLVGYHKKNDKLPLLMLTSSKKKLGFDYKQDDQLVADISIRKDNNYNIWLVVEHYHNHIEN
jgi:hypothetical protein